MKTESTITLKDDLTFKHVFSEEKYLKDFINSFFEFMGISKKVVNVQAVPEYLIKSAYINGKLFFGDVVATLDDSTILSLEMYNQFDEEAFKKSLGYATRLFSNQLEKTEKHINASKVISINLMLGNYNYNNFDFVNDYGFINKKNYGVIKDEYLEMYLVRLDLLEELRYTDINKERFIRWIRLINAKGVDEMKKIAKGDRIMQETVEFVENFLNSEERLEKYDKMNVLLNQAEDKGRSLEKISTVKTMFKKGFSVEDIMKATELPKEEIEVLI